MKRCASAARTSALKTSLTSGSAEALVSACRGQEEVTPKKGVVMVRRSSHLGWLAVSTLQRGAKCNSYCWPKARGFVGSNFPQRGLSQVNTPASGGVMTSGELVAGYPNLALVDHDWLEPQLERHGRRGRLGAHDQLDSLRAVARLLAPTQSDAEECQNNYPGNVVIKGRTRARGLG